MNCWKLNSQLLTQNWKQHDPYNNYIALLIQYDGSRSSTVKEEQMKMADQIMSMWASIGQHGRDYDDALAHAAMIMKSIKG